MTCRQKRQYGPLFAAIHAGPLRDFIKRPRATEAEAGFASIVHTNMQGDSILPCP